MTGKTKTNNIIEELNMIKEEFLMDLNRVGEIRDKKLWRILKRIEQEQINQLRNDVKK